MPPFGFVMNIVTFMGVMTEEAMAHPQMLVGNWTPQSQPTVSEGKKRKSKRRKNRKHEDQISTSGTTAIEELEVSPPVPEDTAAIPEPEAAPAAEPEAAPEEVKEETVAETGVETAVETTEEPKPETAPEPEADTAAEPAAEQAAEPAGETAAEPAGESAAEPAPEPEAPQETTPPAPEEAKPAKEARITAEEKRHKARVENINKRISKLNKELEDLHAREKATAARRLKATKPKPTPEEEMGRNESAIEWESKIRQRQAREIKRYGKIGLASQLFASFCLSSGAKKRYDDQIKAVNAKRRAQGKEPK